MTSAEETKDLGPPGAEVDEAPVPKKAKLGSCEVCDAGVEAKYRCPGCGVVFCSSDCCKKHKIASGCSGMRDKTAFVALEEFDDAKMLSDYVFLEDALRRKDSGYRALKHVAGACNEEPASHPASAMSVVRAAAKRGTTLVLMPEGMTRRKRNTSSYRGRGDVLCWRVEFVFPGCGVTLVSEKVDDSKTLKSALDALLSDPCNVHSLARDPVAGVPTDDLLFLMADCDSPGWDQKFHELSGRAPLKEVLCNKRILEYPVVTVATVESSSKFVRWSPPPPQPQQPPPPTEQPVIVVPIFQQQQAPVSQEKAPQ